MDSYLRTMEAVIKIGVKSQVVEEGVNLFTHKDLKMFSSHCLPYISCNLILEKLVLTL